MVKVIRGDPTIYEIEDLEFEPIIGKFYEEELSGVDKKMVLVKWLGYESDIYISWLKDEEETTFMNNSDNLQQRLNNLRNLMEGGGSETENPVDISGYIPD